MELRLTLLKLQVNGKMAVTLDLFKAMPVIRDILYTENYIFDGMDLYGSVTFEESVNSGQDLELGSCVMSKIEFQLQDLNYLINGIYGTEFTYKQAVKTDETEYEDLARLSRGKIIVVNGGYAYVANGTALSVWNVETALEEYTVSVSPSYPVLAMVVDGDTLYCLHDTSPWATTYSISDDKYTLTPVISPVFSTFYENKIKGLCALSKAINVQGDVIKEYGIEMYNLRPRNLIENTFECVQIGIFTAEKPTKVNDTRIKITCYDNMLKMEKYVDDYVNSVSYPITLKALLSGICGFVGLELASPNGDFTNSNFPVLKNVVAENTSGSQVLRYILELAASFGRVNSEGKLEIGWFSSVDFTIDNSIYVKAETEDYITHVIDKVQVRSTENDIGVIVPPDAEGTNAYIISENPLVYVESDAGLRPYVENIYNKIKNISYKPYKLTLLWEIPLLRAGDIVSLKTRNGNAFPAYIMTRKYTKSADVFSAEGNETRAVQSDALNQSIQSIRGKTNELTRTVEETNSKLTDSVNQLQSEISQTASSLTATITDTANNLQSQITQQAHEISTKVSEDEVSSIIRQSPNDVVFAFNDGNNSQWIKMTGSGFDFYDGDTFIGSMGTNGNQIAWNVEQATSMIWNDGSQYCMWWNAWDKGSYDGGQGGFHSQAVYCDLLYINKNSSANVNLNDHDILNGASIHGSMFYGGDADLDEVTSRTIDTDNLYVTGTRFTRTRFRDGDGNVYYGLLASVNSIAVESVNEEENSLDLLRSELEKMQGGETD